MNISVSSTLAMYVCQARYDEIIAPAVRGEPHVRDDVRCVSIDYIVDALTYTAKREREREILGARCVVCIPPEVNISCR